MKRDWRRLRLIGVGLEKIRKDLGGLEKEDLGGSDRIYRRIGQDSGSEQNVEDLKGLRRIA